MGERQNFFIELRLVGVVPHLISGNHVPSWLGRPSLPAEADLEVGSWTAVSPQGWGRKGG